MSKVKLYTLFETNGIKYNKTNIKRYNSGRGFSEIRIGEEYLAKGFEDDKKMFFKLFNLQNK